MCRNRKNLWSFFCLSVLILASCSTSTPQMISPVGVSPLPSVEETPSSNDVCALSSSGAVPVPVSGRASITGVLYTLTGHGVIPGTRFYLTPILDGAELELPSMLGEPDPLKGQIEGESDARGYFELTEVLAGDYYIAVWAPYNWLIVFGSDSQTPLIVHVEAGDRLALGCVVLAWP